MKRMCRPMTGLWIIVLCAGCFFSQEKDTPDYTAMRAPTFSKDKLENLDLRTVRTVFPPEALVTINPFEPRYQSEVGCLGGIYASGDTGSIIVTVYDGEPSARAQLEARLNAPLDTFEEGGVVKGLPAKWWYKKGSIVTVLFKYGNALVMARLVNLPVENIRMQGNAVTGELAKRLLSIARI